MVLTKSDLVDADMIELVRLEVREFVRGSFLETPRSSPRRRGPVPGSTTSASAIVSQAARLRQPLGRRPGATARRPRVLDEGASERW